jgi:hypothetical protein
MDRMPVYIIGLMPPTPRGLHSRLYRELQLKAEPGEFGADGRRPRNRLPSVAGKMKAERRREDGGEDGD